MINFLNQKQRKRKVKFNKKKYIEKNIELIKYKKIIKINL